MRVDPICFESILMWEGIVKCYTSCLDRGEGVGYKLQRDGDKRGLMTLFKTLFFKWMGEGFVGD